MKKLIYLLSLAIAIVFASCSSSKDELAEYIPEDAIFVAKINTENLINKSGCKIDGKDIIISNAIAKLFECDKTIYGNPIDPSKNIYIFYYKNYNPIILLKVADIEMLKDLNFELSALTEKDGFTIVHIGSREIYFIKDDVAFLMTTAIGESEEDLFARVKTLFDNKGKNDNSKLLAKLEGEEDIICHVDLEKGSKFKSNLLQISAFAKSATAKFNFGKNDISFKVSAETDENNPMLKQVAGLLTNCDTKTLKYFPESTNVIAGLGLNGKALKESGLINLLTLAAPSLANTIPAEEILELVNGDVIVGAELTPDMFSSKVVAAIKSKEPQKLLEYIVSIDRKLFSPTGSNYYLTLMPNVILSAEGDYLIVSNTGKDPEKSLANNKKIKETFEGSLIGGYLNSDFLKTAERSFKKINTDFEMQASLKSFKEIQISLTTNRSDKNNMLEYIIENAGNI